MSLQRRRERYIIIHVWKILKIYALELAVMSLPLQETPQYSLNLSTTNLLR